MKKEYKVSELTIKDLRVLNEKKQQDISKMLEISDTGYRKKEQGISPITVQEGKKLMDFYNLSFEEMYKIVENTKKNKKKDI